MYKVKDMVFHKSLGSNNGEINFYIVQLLP
jgi:hypothetical protein